MEFDSVMAAIAKGRVKCGGAVGITTFISQSLRGGGGFYDTGERVAPTRKRQNKGMAIGRLIDVKFQEYVAAASPAGMPVRMRSIFKVLRQLKIQMLSTQVTVVDHSVGGGVRTRLDGLGYIKRTQTFVVIELKTTQRDHKAHLRNYKVACRRAPEMTNGMANSEYNSHQLQTGFGMRAFEKMYSPKRPVEGLVIMNCSDGKSTFYTVGPAFTRREAFAPAWTNPVLAPPAQRRAGALATVHPKDPAIVNVLKGIGTLKRIVATPDKTAITVHFATTNPVVCGVLTSESKWCIERGSTRLRKLGKKLQYCRRILIFLGANGTPKLHTVK